MAPEPATSAGFFRGPNSSWAYRGLKVSDGFVDACVAAFAPLVERDSFDRPHVERLGNEVFVR
jgi:hypothetical protein